jgi:hypothetical protein
MSNGDKIQLTIYQVDSKIHYKKKMQPAQSINERKKSVVCVKFAVWHFAKLHVLMNTTQKKITVHIYKNLILFQANILTFC